MSNEPYLYLTYRGIPGQVGDPVVVLDSTNLRRIGDALRAAGYLSHPVTTSPTSIDLDIAQELFRAQQQAAIEKEGRYLALKEVEELRAKIGRMEAHHMRCRETYDESERKGAELFEMHLRVVEERDTYAGRISDIEGPAGFGNCDELQGLTTLAKVQKCMATIRHQEPIVNEHKWAGKFLTQIGVPENGALETRIQWLQNRLANIQDELNVEVEKRSTVENEMGSQFMELNNDLRDAIRLALWAAGWVPDSVPGYHDRVTKIKQLADTYKVSLNDSVVIQDSRVSTGYEYLIDTLTDMQSKPKPKTNPNFGDLTED